MGSTTKAVTISKAGVGGLEHWETALSCTGKELDKLHAWVLRLPRLHATLALEASETKVSHRPTPAKVVCNGMAG